LLATVGYQGNEGTSDGVTRQGPEIVVQNVLEAGGIPIPAHADQDKGLLRVKPATRECALDANTVRQIVEIEGLLGVEWLDAGLQPPQCVERSCKHLARVLGSDCHSFQRLVNLDPVEVCRVMEGGREAFARRWARLGREV
jgi:hypothetical protein